MSQTKILLSLALAASSFGAGAAYSQTSTTAPTVRFHTTLGDIDVVLTPGVAPLTVANFLNYVSKGAYVNSIFHRSVPGFIIQGGGYQLQNHAPVATPQSPAVKNEFNVTNARGTIAMAKLGTDPNSATNQWFFNLANNGANLDKQNGGFTVFGRVANSGGLAVMDKIAALPVYNYGSPFDQLPLNNLKGTRQDANFVLVTSIVPLPYVTPAGIESGATFASTNTNGIAPGEVLTLFGTAIGPSQLATLTLDGNGVVTNSLGGTRVLFDGTPAPLLYTSGSQIGVVAPQNLAGKSTVEVIVEYLNVQTAGMQLPVVPANPGIFTLNTSGSGDGAIIRPDGTIINTANPAQPGDILTLYGEGYGAAAPVLADGTIVGSTLPVPAGAVTLLIDGQSVDTTYAGGAPALIQGVLQINFQVPALTPGSHQIQVQVSGRTSPSGVLLETR